MVEEEISTGFKAIMSKNNNFLIRLFWLIAVSISIITLIFHCLILYKKYNYEPDFGVKATQKSMRNLPFPAISICSPVFAKDNIVNYRKFGKIFDLTGKNLSTKERNFFAANYQVCNPTNEIADYLLVKRFLTNRTDFDTIKLIKESSLNINEMMLFCGLNGNVIECEKHFTRVLTDHGFCYTFNMQDSNIVYSDIVSDSLTARSTKISNKNARWTLDKNYPKDFKDNEVPLRAIKENRFAVLLNIKNENAENFCPINGRVFISIIHMPHEIPTMFHDQYYTHYGQGKIFFLTATSYRANKDFLKFSPKARSCYFQNERKLKFFKSYSKILCDYECLTNYTLESCGCVKFSMPHEPNTPICDFDQMKCYAQAIDRWPEKIDSNKIACGCLQTCNDINYGVKYEKEITMDHTKDFLGTELRPANSSDVILTFRFIDHLVIENQKFVAYRIENFIADIGGLLGLFLGCSLISFIELFYTITKILIDKHRKRNTVEKIEIYSTNHRDEFDQKEIMKKIKQIEEENKMFKSIFVSAYKLPKY